MTDLPPPLRWADDIAHHRRWLLSGGTNGAAVTWYAEDLSNCDLPGVVLTEARLVDCIFDRGQLRDADFSRSFAGGTSFDQAHLDGARFVKAELSGSAFTGVRAANASFARATLDHADLNGADLRNVNFEQAYLNGARLAGASLQNGNLWKTVLTGADLTSADLNGAILRDTQMDVATLLNGVKGLEAARVESVVVNGTTLAGEEARCWLATQAKRAVWSIDDFELWLLGKMSGDNVPHALRQLARTEADMRKTAAELGAVFDRPGHAAAEYGRIIGTPLATTVLNETGAFAGSLQRAFHLPLWPDMTFVVNEHPTGHAWGAGFRGGPEALPGNLADVRSPGCTRSSRRARRAGSTRLHISPT